MSKVIKVLAILMMVALPIVGLSVNPSYAKSTKQESKQEETVYITKNGEKYHRVDCRFIKNREVEGLDEQEAIAKGLVPCGRCFKEKVQAKE